MTDCLCTHHQGKGKTAVCSFSNICLYDWGVESVLPACCNSCGIRLTWQSLGSYTLPICCVLCSIISTLLYSASYLLCIRFGYFSFPSTLLKTLRRWHFHSPPLRLGATVPKPPQWHRGMHPIHCWEGIRRWEATILGCMSMQRGQWIDHHISTQETNSHQPVPVLWLTPSSGAQCINGEDIDEQSQRTIVEWCRTCGRGEEDCGCTEGEWLPTEFHPKALRQQNIQTSRGWPETTKDQSDPFLHWQSIWDNQTDPWTSGHQGSLPPTQYPETPASPSPKDPVPMDQHTGVVYQIPCSECPKVYVGQSGRTLKHRLTEHRRALRNGDVAASALAKHVWSSGLNKGFACQTPTSCLPDSNPCNIHPCSPHQGCPSVRLTP